MKSMLTVLLSVALALCMCACEDAGEDRDDLVRLEAGHWEWRYSGPRVDTAEYDLVLSVPEVWVPRGSTWQSFLPGKYVVRGRYDVTSLEVSGAIIGFGWWRLALEDFVIGGASYITPKGQLSGQYETSTVVSEIRGDRENYLAVSLSSQTLDRYLFLRIYEKPPGTE